MTAPSSPLYKIHFGHLFVYHFFFSDSVAMTTEIGASHICPPNEQSAQDLHIAPTANQRQPPDHEQTMPAATEMTAKRNPAIRRRQYAPKGRNGCKTCRQRHMRCDQARPPCSSCRNSSQHCIYDPSRLLGGHESSETEATAVKVVFYEPSGRRGNRNISLNQLRLSHDPDTRPENVERSAITAMSLPKGLRDTSMHASGRSRLCKSPGACVLCVSP
jgi:hypothetical protein